MAQPQPLVNAWTIFSIIYRLCLDPWLPSVGTCIGFVALDTAEPLIFAPGWWKGKEARKQNKKTLYDHPRSRGIGSTQLPETGLLSLGKPCLKLLSYYPWPGIAKLLRHWRLKRPKRDPPSCTPPRLRHTSGVVLLGSVFSLDSLSLSSH